jgi:aminoglycoside phosphotransferase (APT) family kinase protein
MTNADFSRRGPDTPEFVPQRLDDFLKKAIRGLAGPMRVERTVGGQSNPTFHSPTGWT